MKKNKCRVCNNDFLENPLLKYKNMPSVAQYLPGKKDLEDDKGIDLEIFQCSGCGLVQLSNEPVSYYREVIRAAGVSDEMKNFRFRQFNDFVKKYSLKGKKIIEIGCGRGEYLSIMQQVNVKAYGLEERIESVQEGIKKKLKIFRGFIENSDYKIQNMPFDAFFMLAFLEHLPNPNLTLRGIYNNLVDEGLGIIEVPNFNMILKKNLFSEFTRDHLFYFTKDTLKTVLKLNGYDILECNTIWHDYIISSVVRKKEKLDLSKFNEQQKKINKEINNYIDKFKNVAIWGAGHQAFAIMSLAGLENKVKYVIDSASFKQGKYTPATHIPIVPPEKLNDEPVKAVIVMAGSYSDEVTKIIRKKYGNKMKIAVLRDSGLEEIKDEGR